MKTSSFLLFFLLACSFAFFPACKSHKPETAAGAKPEVAVQTKDSLLAGISRGACFGACPQYKAMVYKSGYATYEGERHVKKTGTWSAQLNDEQLQSLYALIRQYKMEEKDTAYINKYLADYPAYLLWISDFRARRQILVNHEAPPVEISEFTQLFERILDQLKWQQQSKARRDEE
ncbi:MAG: hypothetical protein JNL88_11285 [Bacteroidia bacterium]|nr:hypothetical protein [Bacteroidia bacterium]